MLPAIKLGLEDRKLRRPEWPAESLTERRPSREVRGLWSEVLPSGPSLIV